MGYNEFEGTVFGLIVFIGIPVLLIVLATSAIKKARAKANENRLNAGPSLGDLKRLETLAALRDNKAITSAEFESEKAKIMRQT